MTDMKWIDQAKKCDYIRCTPPSLRTLNQELSQSLIAITREGSVISLKVSYLESDFDVTQANHLLHKKILRLIYFESKLESVSKVLEP